MPKPKHGRLRPHQAPWLALHRQAAHPPCCMAPVGLHTESAWGSAPPGDGPCPATSSAPARATPTKMQQNTETWNQTGLSLPGGTAAATGLQDSSLAPCSCKELLGHGEAPPSPLSPKCFAWEHACSRRGTNLLWLQPQSSSGRWWPRAPLQPHGGSPPFQGSPQGEAGTHPTASASQEWGSRPQGRPGTLPPARLPGGDAGSRQTSLTQHNRNSYNFKNMQVCDSYCSGCFN